ncbi:glycosyltransferase [Marinifilum caeruleilacunae]|uniref:Glycosyltransferase family 1 protein n=1 Tax=Marinifilum caeruleilacunae TaxID=2499076 RepID=A0ABX1WTI4_9BACT|nr:glycosyltransferase [Marinifilum caeruleilacunae]NOU59228.1 glycosyltransferase family 1 protein [Marinifilum caeruleilacunae]
MAKKKICIFGGGSMYRLPIYNVMAKELDCDFYICEDDPSKGIKTYDYSQLINYRDSLLPRSIVGNFYWLKNAVSLINKPYDLYIVGGPFCLSYWVLILLTKFSRKNVASWSHGIYGREKKLRKLIKTWYYKLCDINFVYNERAIKLMTECGVQKKKIISVGNSLDTDEDLRVRKSLIKSDIFREYFNNDFPTLIFVGRVTKEKRLDMIIDSMKILNAKGVYLNFVVVGKDIDGVNLNDLVKLNGLEKYVYLYGPCYDNTILGNLFYNADVCVSPGNVGLTAISAMTFGCPVITHGDFSYQGPEFEAINPNFTGDFFRQGDVEDLANVIQKWLDNTNSKKREEIRINTFSEVDNRWNIYSEVQAFKQSLTSFYNNL